MDMINHIHYIADLLLPKALTEEGKGVDRLKVDVSIDINSAAGSRRSRSSRSTTP